MLDFDPLEDELDEADVILGVIEVVRFLTPAGDDLLIYRATDPAGDPLPLTETLGMLRLTEDSAVRDRMAQAEER